MAYKVVIVCVEVIRFTRKVSELIAQYKGIPLSFSTLFSYINLTST